MLTFFLGDYKYALNLEIAYLNFEVKETITTDAVFTATLFKKISPRRWAQKGISKL